MFSLTKPLGLLLAISSCVGTHEEDFGLHTHKGDVYTEEKWIKFSEGAIGLKGQELVDYINRNQDLWTASLSDTTFPLMPLDLLDERRDYDAPTKTLADFSNETIPNAFDVRTKHPECREVISTARSQFGGTCWAYAATGVAADRRCIGSSGRLQDQLSVADVADCCTDCHKPGCTSGTPIHAYEFWAKHGIVTESCVPDTHKSECGGVCPVKCATSENYNSSKTYGQSHYKLKKNAEVIQREILAHGSASAVFTVYRDFHYHYHGQIYRPLANQTADGLHAVRIIGWGEEAGTKFWTAVNSWGQTWPHHQGDGTFRIVRGENVCGFENRVTAGVPRL